MIPESSLLILYIDPGIGFLTLQLLGGSLLGIAFYFRRTTFRILRGLRLVLRRKDAQKSEKLDR